MNNNKIEILFGLEATDGGSLKHLNYLVLNLDRKVFSITVALSTKRSLRVLEVIKKFEENGVIVHTVPMNRNINILSDLRAFLNIYRLISASKFDIVHAHSSKAGALFRIAARMSNVKAIIYTPHAFYFQGKKGIIRFIYRKTEALLGLITTAVVVSSNEKQHALENKIVPENKLVNINNGINFREYSVENSQIGKQKLGLKKNELLVGSIGRLTKQKNWTLLIEAAQHVLLTHPDVQFFILGDGEESQRLMRTITKFNVHNNFSILNYNTDVSAILSAADIFVSTSKWEGLPYALLEAMYFKKPIIATDIGYVNVLNSRNALLVEQNNPRALAESIIKLLMDETLMCNLRDEAYATLNSNFNYENFIRLHERLYKSVMKPVVTKFI